MAMSVAIMTSFRIADAAHKCLVSQGCQLAKSLLGPRVDFFTRSHP
jgi:hypothetical protein